jgi:putative ABC transport system permease protein
MRGLVDWLLQVFIVTTMHLRNLPRRAGASISATIGVALVVVVLVAVLSIAEGFRETLEAAGNPDNVIVMRGGTDTEMNSVLDIESTRIVANAPGVLRGESGPLASAELSGIVDIPKLGNGADSNVPLRGVQPGAFRVRPDVEIVEGRTFEPGKNELIAGIGAAEQFAGLRVGDQLRWGDITWNIVGHFSAGGSLWESELWCDVAVSQPAFNRGATFQAVYVTLADPASYEEFKDALTTDPRLDVKVLREPEYFSDQSRMLHGIITGLGFLVAGLMGVGAVFGAINTMYSAVAARNREIATLRALGFSGGPVIVSVIAESLALAFLGGLAGGGIAWLAFHGYRAATLNFDTFSQVAFTFSVTPGLLGTGIGIALLMGFLGGLLPAVRAARLPVATALREL